MLGCRLGPALRSKQPQITHGVQSGDPQAATGTAAALVWARCDEPARMLVEWDTTDRFDRPHRVTGSVVTPERDGCGVVELAGLPVGQTIAYRVRFEREAARGRSGWAAGRLRTPRSDRVRIAWTGDTCGQGFGRNAEWGGLRGFDAIRRVDADVFVNSGDLIYADNPIEAELKLPDGRTWRNVTDERVARVAQELDDFRARFAYNLGDDHLRALAAELPVIAQWDDHETHNNWFPGQQLDDDRYTQLRDASKLAAMARRAMFEWVPVPAGPVHRVIHYGPLIDVFVLDCRSFRSANSPNLGDDVMLGAPQVDWLLAELARSTARWKIIACDQPIGVVIDDGDNQEGFANADAGPPRGRERELARLLMRMMDTPAASHNAIWITADVHYTAAHHFDPARARAAAFDPFWEFVVGPIHAGNFGPNPIDLTLGPEVRFQWAPPPGEENLSPWEGMQSFGTIDATPDALAIALRDIDGGVRYRVEIPYVG